MRFLLQANQSGLFRQSADFIGFINSLLGGFTYCLVHGAGLSGVLFPPRCHVQQDVTTSRAVRPIPRPCRLFFVGKRILSFLSLDFSHEPGHLSTMVEPVSLNSARDDTLWAVVAYMGRTTRVAEIFSNRVAALADKAWREQQVRAYTSFLRTSTQPAPSYDVRPIKRAELPRSWRPLPALGFLHGKIV
jgi:hypothetical protein